ncbi:hypothetical protein [Actinomadura macrotermitis]|uniref:Mce-associated membrane protein n=1 Tax=Actinomadura macrotermitis TaxID=2585200 RepID=A0A7K0BZA2_9ACTN|nr:hypothetical protein [Actinomadura macrotermitis]MQY06182.1 hypothetical protein [Actinomadura macrotermitis]
MTMLGRGKRSAKDKPEADKAEDSVVEDSVVEDSVVEDTTAEDTEVAAKAGDKAAKAAERAEKAEEASRAARLADEAAAAAKEAARLAQAALAAATAEAEAEKKSAQVAAVEEDEEGDAGEAPAPAPSLKKTAAKTEADDEAEAVEDDAEEADSDDTVVDEPVVVKKSSKRLKKAAAEADEDDDADEDDEDAPAAGRTWRPYGGMTTLACSLVLIVALLAGGIVLFLKTSKASAIEDAADKGVFAASRAAQDLSSYDYRTLDTDFKTASAATTGKLHTQYDQLAQQLRASAVQQQAVSTTTVIKAGVVSATPDKVVALVYANRTTSTKADKQPRLPEALRIKMTMVKSHGKWLASELVVIS